MHSITPRNWGDFSCTNHRSPLLYEEKGTQKELHMNARTKIIGGIFSYVIAICLVSIHGIDDEFALGGIFFVALGTYLLWSEWSIFMSVLWKLGNARAKKVEKERHCAVCAAPPIYMIRLVAIDPTQPISAIAGSELFVCEEHHPNKELAPKAGELHQLIKRIDKNLTYNCVYPCALH